MLHSAIRSVDDRTLVFWEPVTWGYVLPFKAEPVRDAILRDFLSEFSELDLLDVLKFACGEETVGEGSRPRTCPASQPILVLLWARSLSVATLVVVGDGWGRHLGCAKVFMSPMCHLYSISTQGQVLE